MMKKAMIKINDIIEFTNIKTSKTMLCQVVKIYRYKNFDELYMNHS